MSLVMKFITGYASGLTQNKKPLLIPDQAWQTLENAYVYRERVRKREGIKHLGRLRRNFTNINIGFNPGGTSSNTFLKVIGYISNITNAANAVVTSISPHKLMTGDIVTFTDVNGMININGLASAITVIDAFTFSVLINSLAFPAYTNGGVFFSSRDLTATEPNAEMVPGTMVYTLHAGPDIVFVDDGMGRLISATPGNSGTINYTNGNFTTTTTAPPVTLASGTFSYYPGLPVMGIWQREISSINDEQTIWFDEIYAYIWNGAIFTEFIPGYNWNSSNSDFFWAFNYRGALPSQRLFFATNFVNTFDNPMRYTDGAIWTTFAPLVSATDTLFSARILIAYYGRLLALNVWEGPTASGAAGASNIFNRCRFSQLGSPVAVDAWRSDQFGKGGFLDAPTNEAIIGATFIKNTLVVTFERTTWQLRYVGEYGLPFIWERVSADFGSESTFSSVLFDNHMLSVGDKAIIAANGGGADRIDLDIPDKVFEIQNTENAPKRIFGIRDYQKEVVFWNYVDGNTQAAPGLATIFPTNVILYNYRNNTWAIFRDTVTSFGIFQLNPAITWDSQDVFWDDEEVLWNDLDTESLFPSITCGNQQGFVSIYAYITEDEKSLSITGMDLTVSPIVVTSPNHNLQPGETIRIDGLLFVDNVSFLPLATDLNGVIYQVQQKDANSFYLYKWDGTEYVGDFPFTPVTTATYIGGGTITLFPKLNAVTKDFSLFQDAGLQTKLSSIDFLVEVTPESAMSVKLYINANQSVVGNVLVGNRNMSTTPTNTFYPPSNVSDYAYYSFYATTVGQFFSINVTYDDTLMNNITTHKNKWVLLAINAKCRQGGRMTN